MLKIISTIFFNCSAKIKIILVTLTFSSPSII
nr:MAG TPA: hypothetical protein [Bacteriophage sp.]